MDKETGRRYMTNILNESVNIPKSNNIQYILVTNILTRTATSGHDDQHLSRSACYSALLDQNPLCSLSSRTLRIDTFKGRF